MATPIRQVLAYTIAIVVLLAASACNKSESPGPTGAGNVTSGTIGGLAFTVVSGTVVQSGANQPITATAQASILFDDNIPTLGGGDKVAMAVYGDIADGGQVTAMGHGASGDAFAGALAAAVQRSGADYLYGLFWGLEAVPPSSGTFTTVAGPSVGVIAAFDNTYTPAYISVWHPDWAGTAPFDTCDAIAETNSGGVVAQGNGNQLAITFSNATISDVVVDVAPLTACF